jgi:predicted aconitase
MRLHIKKDVQKI